MLLANSPAGRKLFLDTNGGLLSASFELDGQEFTAINGGPHFKCSPAISFVVLCENQDEVDHYWIAQLRQAHTKSQCKAQPRDGMCAVNFAPPSVESVTAICPPCRRTAFRAIASPSPKPPVSRSRLRSRR